METATQTVDQVHKVSDDDDKARATQLRELLQEHARRKGELLAELETRAEKMRLRLSERLDTRRELNAAFTVAKTFATRATKRRRLSACCLAVTPTSLKEGGALYSVGCGRP